VPSLPAALHVPLAYLSGWPRRIAALLCLLLAATSVLTRTSARSAATTPTVVASHRLPAGTLLSRQDLRVTAWPAPSMPAGAAQSADAVVGRRMATALGQGMPVTADDLLEPAIARALATGQAATTVDLASESQLAMLRTGARVDLYASPMAGTFVPQATGAAGSPGASGGIGSPVARDAEVLSILPPAASLPDARPALVVATDRATAAQLAQVPGSFLATLVRPP